MTIERRYLLNKGILDILSANRSYSNKIIRDFVLAAYETLITNCLHFKRYYSEPPCPICKASYL